MSLLTYQNGSSVRTGIFTALFTALAPMFRLHPAHSKSINNWVRWWMTLLEWFITMMGFAMRMVLPRLRKSTRYFQIADLCWPPSLAWDIPGFRCPGSTLFASYPQTVNWPHCFPLLSQYIANVLNKMGSSRYHNFVCHSVCSMTPGTGNLPGGALGDYKYKLHPGNFPHFDYLLTIGRHIATKFLC